MSAPAGPAIIELSDLALGREIGRGSFGAAYAATWHGRAVCAKGMNGLIDPELYAAPPGSPAHTRLLEELTGEASILSSLRHTNILAVFGVCVGAQTRAPKWIVTELADTTYVGFLKSGVRPLSVEVFRDDCRQILSGLSYLHTLKRKLVHRDLKPDNVLVVASGGDITLKIADFGLARITSTSGRLAAGYGGAMFYLAPEIMAGSFDAKVDVFSFGIMMCEVVLEYLPIPGYAAIVTPDRAYGMEGRFDMVAEAVKRLRVLSPPLADLISACCAKTPEGRLTSVEALSRLDAGVATGGAGGGPRVEVVRENPLLNLKGSPAASRARPDSPAISVTFVTPDVMKALRDSGVTGPALDGVSVDLLDNPSMTPADLCKSMRSHRTGVKTVVDVIGALTLRNSKVSRGSVSIPALILARVMIHAGVDEAAMNAAFDDVLARPAMAMAAVGASLCGRGVAAGAAVHILAALVSHSDQVGSGGSADAARVTHAPRVVEVMESAGVPATVVNVVAGRLLETPELGTSDVVGLLRAQGVTPHIIVDVQTALSEAPPTSKKSSGAGPKLKCTITGSGHTECVTDDPNVGENLLRVTVQEDSSGARYTGLIAADVDVYATLSRWFGCGSVRVGSVLSRRVVEAGVVELVYMMPEKVPAALTLRLQHRGQPLGEAWVVQAGNRAALATQRASRVEAEGAAERPRVEPERRRVEEAAESQAALELARPRPRREAKEALTRALSTESLVLSRVPSSSRAAFLQELAGWLTERSYSLLYRGSRDGMTPGDFHRKCDGMGPTLVLVRSDNGFAFGGYASVSWRSSGASSGASGSFLFTIVSPHGGVRRFPLRPSSVDDALRTDRDKIVFEGGFKLDALNSTSQFSGSYSRCSIGAYGGFEDVLGKGSSTFTGRDYFTPEEVEVYSVKEA